MGEKQIMVQSEDWNGGVFSYDVFEKGISEFVEAHPESAWHLRGSEKRVWQTVKEALRYLKEDSIVVDFGCLPPNTAIGFHIAGVMGSLLLG